MFRGKPRLLMVEDEKNNHELYRDAFGAAGFEMLVCANAEDNFLEEVIDFNPDLISMDLMIAKAGVADARDGFEAIELLNSHPKTKHIPVIVLTNFFQADRVTKAKELGAIDYINAQGDSLSNIAERFMEYARKPKKYIPTHQAFR